MPARLGLHNRGNAIARPRRIGPAGQEESCHGRSPPEVSAPEGGLVPGSMQGPGTSPRSNFRLASQACRPGRDGYRGEGERARL